MPPICSTFPSFKPGGAFPCFTTSGDQADEAAEKEAEIESLSATDPAQAAFVLAAGAEGVVQQWLAAPRDVEPFCDAEALAEAMVVPYATDLQAGETPAPDATHGGDLSPPF